MVLAIEIHLLCQILVLLVRFLLGLITESFELKTIHFLWLLDHHAEALAGQGLEDWSKSLGSWNHLCSSFFSGVHILSICHVILAVVVDEGGAEANIAFLWCGCLAIIVKITICVNVFVIVDLLNELQLNTMSRRRTLWILWPILVVASCSFEIRFILNSLDLSFTAVSGAGTLSHLTAETVRWVTELVWWSLWGNHLA